MAADAAVVWGVVIAIAVGPRLIERCWSWADLGVTVILLLLAGPVHWFVGVLIAMFTSLVIDSLNLWRVPPGVPDPRLDELFPEHREYVEHVRAIRAESLVWPGYLFRFGVITALLASGVWILARLPTCPAELHMFWD